MSEITDPETGETLTLIAGDIGVSPIEHARLRKERDELREALGPMLQYAILCIRQARDDKLPESTVQIAERDLRRAQEALATKKET